MSRRTAYPHDLREDGRPDDPLFNRPLVYARIDTGEVQFRRPGSDVMERHEVGTREAPSMKRERNENHQTPDAAATSTTDPVPRRPGPKPGQGAKRTARLEQLEARVAELERRLDAAESRLSVDMTRELLRLLEIAVAGKAGEVQR